MSGKKSIYVIALLFMLLCFSCIEKYEAIQLMDDAEAIFAKNADSAQFLLDEVEFQVDFTVITPDGSTVIYSFMAAAIGDV